MQGKIIIPKNVLHILKTLENAGFESYVVGGSVRDFLRGEVPKDWDVATQAAPHKVKGLFPRTVDTGIKHGTVTVLMGKERVEVTTFRVDGEYLDRRRPEHVDFTKEIHEDLSRRDFTMNAIAYSPDRGFVDPFEGRVDIEIKIIRSVGDARMRFGEDALRMLRAIRFAGVFGFVIEESSCEAISELRENIQNVSAERIRDELGKLLLGEHPEALDYLRSTGLMPFVLRDAGDAGLSAGLSEIIDQMKKAPADEPIRLALFFNRFGEKVPDILRALRFDNKTKRTVSHYIRYLHEPTPPCRVRTKKLMRLIPPDVLENLLGLKEIVGYENLDPVRCILRDIIDTGECYSLSQLKISGRELIALNIEPGKKIGETLETLLEAVIHDPSLNEKEKLVAMIT